VYCNYAPVMLYKRDTRNMSRMRCNDLLQEGRIFEARELMTQDTKNSSEIEKVYETIKNEYADLKSLPIPYCKKHLVEITKKKQEHI